MTNGLLSEQKAASEDVNTAGTKPQKIKSWWSDDRAWFCILVDDGVNKATVSLTPEEADELAATIEAPSPAVEKAISHFYRKAGEYDREKQVGNASSTNKGNDHA